MALAARGGHVGLGARDFAAERGQQRRRLEAGFAGTGCRQPAHVGPFTQGPARGLGADIALQRGLGLRDACLDAEEAVVERHHLAACGQRLDRAAAAAAVGGVDGFDQQPRLVALALDQGLQAFEVMALQPRQRSRLLRCGLALVALRLGDGGLGLEAGSACAALVLARELARDADVAHGHEVARQAEALGAVGRQVDHAQAQHRVGQLRRGHRALARRAGGGVLRAQRGSLIGGAAQRIVEVQSWRLRCAGRTEQAEDKGQQRMLANRGSWHVGAPGKTAVDNGRLYAQHEAAARVGPQPVNP